MLTSAFTDLAQIDLDWFSLTSNCFCQFMTYYVYIDLLFLLAVILTWLRFMLSAVTSVIPTDLAADVLYGWSFFFCNECKLYLWTEQNLGWGRSKFGVCKQQLWRPQKKRVQIYFVIGGGGSDV
uniref:Uncharacterized protein n=1 Tax=Pyxicephalus adspersus TaxID=30357 RepID=A0AAV3B0R3_PYXAD|nr:TPA: hypothetical protein GDO54_000163 [Pyxicephalus adspersus]